LRRVGGAGGPIGGVRLLSPSKTRRKQAPAEGYLRQAWAVLAISGRSLRGAQGQFQINLSFVARMLSAFPVVLLKHLFLQASGLVAGMAVPTMSESVTATKL